MIDMTHRPLAPTLPCRDVQQQIVDEVVHDVATVWTPYARLGWFFGVIFKIIVKTAVPDDRNPPGSTSFDETNRINSAWGWT